MAGMRVTLNSAMRARDVSTPRPEHEAAATQWADRLTAPQPPRPHGRWQRATPPGTTEPATALGETAGQGARPQETPERGAGPRRDVPERRTNRPAAPGDRLSDSARRAQAPDAARPAPAPNAGTTAGTSGHKLRRRKRRRRTH